MDKKSVAAILSLICPLEERVTNRELRMLGMSNRQARSLMATQILGCTDYTAWISRAYPVVEKSAEQSTLTKSELQSSDVKSNLFLTKRERKKAVLSLDTLLPLTKCVNACSLSDLKLHPQLVGRLICWQPRFGIKEQDTAYLWMKTAMDGFVQPMSTKAKRAPKVKKAIGAEITVTGEQLQASTKIVPKSKIGAKLKKLSRSGIVKNPDSSVKVDSALESGGEYNDGVRVKTERPSKVWFDKLRDCKPVSEAVSIANDIRFAYYPKKAPKTESTIIADKVGARSYGRVAIKQSVRPFSGRCDAPIINARVVNFYGSNPFAKAVDNFRRRIQPRRFARGYDSDLSDERKRAKACTKQGYHSEGGHPQEVSRDVPDLHGSYGHIVNTDTKSQIKAQHKAKVLMKKKLQGKKSLHPGLGYNASDSGSEDRETAAPTSNGSKSIVAPLCTTFVSSGYYSKGTPSVSLLDKAKTDTLVVSPALNGKKKKKRTKKKQSAKKNLKADSNRIGHALRTVKKGLTVNADSGAALRELACTIASQSDYVSKAVTTMKQLHVAHSRSVRDLELRDEYARSLKEQPLLDKMQICKRNFNIEGTPISTFVLKWSSLADVSSRYEFAFDKRFPEAAISFNAMLDISKSKTGSRDTPMYNNAVFTEFLLHKCGVSDVAGRLKKEYHDDCFSVFSALKKVFSRNEEEQARGNSYIYTHVATRIALVKRVVTSGLEAFQNECCGYNHWLSRKFDLGNLIYYHDGPKVEFFTGYSYDLNSLFSSDRDEMLSFADMRDKFSDIALVKDMYPLLDPVYTGSVVDSDIICPPSEGFKALNANSIRFAAVKS